MTLPIIYLRSSFISSWDFCQHKWFLDYTLGIGKYTNRKAEAGTITHRVLELLAIIKTEFQNGKQIVHLVDEDLKIDINITQQEFNLPTELTPTNIENINSTRKNKDTYLPEHQIKPGHIRYGVEYVEYLIDKAYAYYVNKSQHTWTRSNFRDVVNFVWMTLDYKGGLYDPRSKNIVSPEQYFDIQINEPWAAYDFTYRGKRLQGQLRLRGTMDLTVSHDDGFYELVDYKTGQRKNWATGEIKTYDKLQHDSQLLLYYYAAKQLYPDKDIMVTIFFIRAGGPYTICFDDSSIEVAKQLFQKYFKDIQRCQYPTLLDAQQRDFRCKRLCEYYKTKLGEPNTCLFLSNEIQNFGLDYTINLYSEDGFSIADYNAPGE